MKNNLFTIPIDIQSTKNLLEKQNEKPNLFKGKYTPRVSIRIYPKRINQIYLFNICITSMSDYTSSSLIYLSGLLKKKDEVTTIIEYKLRINKFPFILFNLLILLLFICVLASNNNLDLPSIVQSSLAIFICVNGLLLLTILYRIYIQKEYERLIALMEETFNTSKKI